MSLPVEKLQEQLQDLRVQLETKVSGRGREMSWLLGKHSCSSVTDETSAREFRLGSRVCLITHVGLFHVLLQLVLAGRRVWSLCLTGWQRLFGYHCHLVKCLCGSCEEPEITQCCCHSKTRDRTRRRSSQVSPDGRGCIRALSPLACSTLLSCLL